MKGGTLVLTGRRLGGAQGHGREEAGSRRRGSRRCPPAATHSVRLLSLSPRNCRQKVLLSGAESLPLTASLRKQGFLCPTPAGEARTTEGPGPGLGGFRAPQSKSPTAAKRRFGGTGRPLRITDGCLPRGPAASPLCCREPARAPVGAGRRCPEPPGPREEEVTRAWPQPPGPFLRQGLVVPSLS